MQKMKHRAVRVRAGKYMYRGYEINCIYNHEPEGRDVWECVDSDGSGFGHCFRLRDAKKAVDFEIERKNRETTVFRCSTWNMCSHVP